MSVTIKDVLAGITEKSLVSKLFDHAAHNGSNYLNGHSNFILVCFTT
jgi:hypothetical protein